MGNAIVGGDMEKRCRDKCRRYNGCRRQKGFLIACDFGKGQSLNLSRESNVHDVVDTTAVGELRTFRQACRARGIKNTGIVVRVDGDLWKIGGKIRWCRNDIRPGRHARCSVQCFGEAHPCDLEIGECGADFKKPLQPFAVTYDDLGSAVFQAILQFTRHPPGIYADGNGTKRQDCPIGQHPFWIVAHGDGHPVMLTDALGAKPDSNGFHLRVGLVVGPAFVLVDEIVAVAVCCGQLPHVV